MMRRSTVVERQNYFTTIVSWHRARRRVPWGNNTHQRTLRSLMFGETPPTLDSPRHSEGVSYPERDTILCHSWRLYRCSRHHSSFLVIKETRETIKISNLVTSRYFIKRVLRKMRIAKDKRIYKYTLLLKLIISFKPNGKEFI